MQSTVDADTSPVTDGFIDALAKVQTGVVDAVAGYETMVKRCEREILEIVQSYLDLHKQHDAQLSSRLRALRQEPDEDGSFFATVQKTVVSARALFDFVGTNALPQIIEGEERLLGRYRDALVAAAIVTDQDMLETQIGELERLNEQAREAARA